MTRKPIETENQDGYFACEGCRDERCHEEQDLRVDADGVCWCNGCYTEDHTWEEWNALKPFVPKVKQELARKDAEISRLRAALERCRDLPRSIKWGNDGDCGITRELDRVCTDALEGKR